MLSKPKEHKCSCQINNLSSTATFYKKGLFSKEVLQGMLTTTISNTYKNTPSTLVDGKHKNLITCFIYFSLKWLILGFFFTVSFPICYGFIILFLCMCWIFFICLFCCFHLPEKEREGQETPYGGIWMLIITFWSRLLIPGVDMSPCHVKISVIIIL